MKKTAPRKITAPIPHAFGNESLDGIHRSWTRLPSPIHNSLQPTSAGGKCTSVRELIALQKLDSLVQARKELVSADSCSITRLRRPAVSGIAT